MRIHDVFTEMQLKSTQELSAFTIHLVHGLSTQ